MSDNERLSKTLPTRILATSGLSWNHDSRNKPRDWERYATAATGETGLVQMYREKLLRGCPPANALRKDLHDIFFSWSASKARIPTGGQEGYHISKLWEFADNISITDSEVQQSRPDFGKMRLEWEESVGTGIGSKKKARKAQKDSIATMLQGLKSNKFLHCSDDDVPKGTLESLSAFAITILGHVM